MCQNPKKVNCDTRIRACKETSNTTSSKKSALKGVKSLFIDFPCVGVDSPSGRARVTCASLYELSVSFVEVMLVTE